MLGMLICRCTTACKQLSHNVATICSEEFVQLEHIYLKDTVPTIARISLTEAVYVLHDFSTTVEGVTIVLSTFNTFVPELGGVVRIEGVFACDSVQSGFVDESVGSAFVARGPGSVNGLKKNQERNREQHGDNSLLSLHRVFKNCFTLST